MSVSTHVLDAVRGVPARGLGVRLERDDGTLIAAGVTDGDGRVGDFAGDIEAGVYRLRFDVENYWGGQATETFYPEVLVTFRVTSAGAKHHVPLLLSPFAYSTYRGS
jgi:5-hydroxyisourate hydrolase